MYAKRQKKSKMISESPDKKWSVRVDEEGKFHWTDTKHIYGKYSIEEILEAMDIINGVQKSE